MEPKTKTHNDNFDPDYVYHTDTGLWHYQPYHWDEEHDRQERQAEYDEEWGDSVPFDSFADY